MVLKERLGKKWPLGGAKPPNLLIIALLLAFRSRARAPSIHATNKTQSHQTSKEVKHKIGKQSKQAKERIMHANKRIKGANKHANKHAKGTSMLTTERTCEQTQSEGSILSIKQTKRKCVLKGQM